MQIRSIEKELKKFLSRKRDHSWKEPGWEKGGGRVFYHGPQ